MRGALVAFDLETTGLNPQQDRIIELGAVRVENGQITATYSQLVNPGMAIPSRSTLVHGITQADVAKAPPLYKVLPDFSAFIGDRPVVAHSASFDLAFLQPQGLLLDNPVVDTYELASVLLPRAPRYSLHDLTEHLGIGLPADEVFHRALADARAAALLYTALWERLLALPYDLIAEIDAAAHPLNWGGGAVFAAARAEREHAAGGQPPLEAPRPLFTLPPDDHTSLRPLENPAPLQDADVMHGLGAGGPLAQALPGYEQRDSQIAMAIAVARALRDGQHMLLEAGTGTGKTLAYLVPAMLWAARTGQRVVVSTNTINLQDQLVLKDIPTLQAVLGLPIRTAVLKGRANYLCPRRLNTVRRRGPTSVEELRTLAKVLVWQLDNGSGDRSEISLRGPAELSTWSRLSAQDEDCSVDRCRVAMAGVCPFYKARRAADAAHIVVVNHALLIADATTDSRVLPPYENLVLDEAHHLEDAVSSSLSTTLDEAMLLRRLNDLGGPYSGLLGDLLAALRAALPEDKTATVTEFITDVATALAAMRTPIGALFGALRAVVDEFGAGRTDDFQLNIRVRPNNRNKPAFLALSQAWRTLDEYLEVISGALARLGNAIRRLETQYDIAHSAELMTSVQAAAGYLADLRAQLDGFVQHPADNTVYWVAAGQDPTRLAFTTAPLDVGPYVRDVMWGALRAAVLTSATLTTSQSFSFIRQRTDARDETEVQALSLPSPFDYQAATLLYLPTDIDEPNKPAYQGQLERALVELATALDGRVMALFTSYTHLRQTARIIGPRLAAVGISLFDQTEGASRDRLLDGFRNAGRAVLLGTRSFWEGVDIPGDSLSALVITKLPFPVPTDPLFAARAERYADPFNDYTVPEAVLRFRQGFGRLIRTSTDRGIVVVFDRRVTSKDYGPVFLASLPECTVREAPLADLPGAAQAWLSQALPHPPS